MSLIDHWNISYKQNTKLFYMLRDQAVFALFTVLQHPRSTALPNQGSSTAAGLVLRHQCCGISQGLNC